MNANDPIVTEYDFNDGHPLLKEQQEELMDENKELRAEIRNLNTKFGKLIEFLQERNQATATPEGVSQKLTIKNPETKKAEREEFPNFLNKKRKFPLKTRRSP